MYVTDLQQKQDQDLQIAPATDDPAVEALASMRRFAAATSGDGAAAVSGSGSVDEQAKAPLNASNTAENSDVSHYRSSCSQVCAYNLDVYSLLHQVL
jgi:hypothetical protein